MTNTLTNSCSNAELLIGRDEQFRTLSATNNFVVAITKRIFHMLKVWNKRDQDRRRLAEMEPHLLKDLGIEPYEVSREVAKRFWVK